ncbi:MAG: hypothetical protein GY717_15880 [Rhodobacteraceae bacterium]|nr:hypothetical protein [Paracoccaceae bacterium]
MNVLRDVGWVPSLPDQWMRADGQVFAVIEEHEHANAEIPAAIQEQIIRAAWCGASAHYLGAGLEQGVPGLEPYRRCRARFKRQGWHGRAAALDVIVCGGVWIGDRAAVTPEGRQMSNACARCGAATESAFHRYYGCPSLRDLQDEYGDIAGTAWLVQRARDSWDRWPCL